MPGGLDFKITVGGSALSEAELTDVLEVTVNTDLHLPGMFTIVLHDAPEVRALFVHAMSERASETIRLLEETARIFTGV